MENDLEEVAKKRVQTRMGFIIHLTMYLAMNVGFIAIWYLTGRGYPWFMWPAIGWGIGIIAHGAALLVGPGSATEKRAIDRELQRLQARG
jgi:hypothetical protein